MNPESVRFWVSEVLNSSNIPSSISNRMLEVGPEKALLELQKMNMQAPLGIDVFGLLSTSISCARKRRNFLSSLPVVNNTFDLNLLWSWIKVLSVSRYRLLRSAIVLGSLNCVDQLLGQAPRQNDISSKTVYSFCGHVARQVVLVRSKDTFPVIRQLVAEFLIRRCLASDVAFFTSSVFGKTGEIVSIVYNLLCDEDMAVCRVVLDGLVALPSALLPIVLSSEHHLLVNNLLLIKCTELFELLENGNPPYLDLLRGEIVSLCKIIVSPNEQIFQLLFDKFLPLEARISLAKLVAQFVLSSDITQAEFTNYPIGIAMITEFVQQYKLADSEDGMTVFESFFACMHKDQLAGYGAVSSGVVLHALSTVADDVCIDDFPSLFRQLGDDTHTISAILTFLKISPTLVDMDVCIDFLCEYLLRCKLYAGVYLGYQVWDRLARLNFRVKERLNGWGAQIRSDWTTNLVQIHAMESVIECPLMENNDLIDHVLAGRVEQVHEMICALDLAFIQTLKSSCSDLYKTNLHNALTFLYNETCNDPDAKLLMFFCQYRLEETTQNKKDKASILVPGCAKTLNQYILRNIFDKHNLPENILSMESYIPRE